MNRYSLSSQTTTDTAALESVLQTLVSGDFQSRWDAIKQLPAFEAAAIAPLLELLQAELAEDDADGELIWFMTQALGHFNHPVVICTLQDLLHSTDDSEIAAITASTLANFGEVAIPILTELLSRDKTRLIAVQALAQVRHPDVIPPLLDVVHDPTPEVRSATIEALSHFYDSSITAALRSALSDPMRSVRRAAVIALGIQAQRLDADSLVADLTPLLRDLHFEVCRQAVIALGRVGTETAVAALSQLLQSTQTPIELQVETVRALSWIGSASAMTVIRACFDSALPAYLPSITGTAAARDQLQREIVAILGRVESATAKIMALQILQQLLETAHPVSDTSPGKQQIAVSLGHLRDANAIPALIQLAADADLIVRLHAIAALKQTPSAYEQLQQRWSEIGSRCQDADDLKTGVEIALQEW